MPLPGQPRELVVPHQSFTMTSGAAPARHQLLALLLQSGIRLERPVFSSRVLGEVLRQELNVSLTQAQCQRAHVRVGSLAAGEVAQLSRQVGSRLARETRVTLMQRVAPGAMTTDTRIGQAWPRPTISLPRLAGRADVSQQAIKIEQVPAVNSQQAGNDRNKSQQNPLL